MPSHVWYTFTCFSCNDRSSVPRQTAGYKLLGEMSLAELKERLSLLREAQLAEQQQRREHILEEKEKKKQQLVEHLDKIDIYRRMQAQAAAVRSGKTFGSRKMWSEAGITYSQS